MSKPPLTDKEKSDKRQRDALQYLTNGIRSEWSFKKFKTWTDIYKRLGYDDRYIASKFTSEQINKPLVWLDLRAFLEKLSIELEERLSKPTITILDQAKERKLEDFLQPKEQKTSLSDVLLQHKDQTIITKEETSNQVAESILESKDSEIELDLTSSNNYGYTPSLNVSPSLSLLWFQKKAIAELKKKIVDEKRSGVLLILDAGYGKTFIMYGLMRWLVDIDWFTGKTISHIKQIYITPSTILEQSDRVAKSKFNLHDGFDYELINIEVLRSKAGKFWIKEELRIIDGEEVVTFRWKPMINPPIIFLDESQKAKNSDAKVTKIISAYNDLPKNNTLVAFSATPFSTIAQAKYFAVATHRPLGPQYGFPEGTVLTNATWPTYAALMAAPAKPTDFNEAAIERLMDDLKDWIVEPKGIRPQFRPNNMVKTVDFRTEEERIFYITAWQRFLEEMAKIKKEIDEERYRFVILLKYAMAAEESKADLYVDEMIASAKRGKAPACAVKFKCTIIKMVQKLDKLGISRDKISLIWGGGQTQLTQKQKAKAKIKEQRDVMEAAGVDVDELMETMELDKVDDRILMNLPVHLRLGPQDLDQRQEEIDRYQRGDSTYAIYTFKAGGVGLSLPHSDELCSNWNVKKEGFNEWYKKNEIEKLVQSNKLLRGHARRKESGYAYEEDIPFITTKPRELFSSVTYSEMDMAQSLKRCARINSLSITDQTMFLWRNTIETDIYHILLHKTRSLDKVRKLGDNTNWLEVIAGTKKENEYL